MLAFVVAALAAAVVGAAAEFAENVSDSSLANLVWVIFAAEICCASMVILAHIDCESPVEAIVAESVLA